MVKDIHLQIRDHRTPSKINTNTKQNKTSHLSQANYDEKKILKAGREKHCAIHRRTLVRIAYDLIRNNGIHKTVTNIFNNNYKTVNQELQGPVHSPFSADPSALPYQLSFLLSAFYP